MDKCYQIYNGREKKMCSDELKEYVEKNIFPEYSKNERAHGIEHIRYVIDRCFELIKQNNLNVDCNKVYVIAAYHDIGHHIDAKKHELISAEIMYNDANLLKYFSKEDLKIMKEAIEDHRASNNLEPRSIYGKIISSADRNTSVEQCLSRSYFYGKKILPGVSDDEIFENAYNVLVKKFGVNGYSKFFFKDEKYEKFLTDIRELLKDKKSFCESQKHYIELLKEQDECR